ncbi:hypothetical protein H5410_002750, partial [Solanum commersonii]
YPKVKVRKTEREVKKGSCLCSLSICLGLNVRCGTLNMGISARSNLRRNSSARSTRSCCGRLSQRCLDHRLHNRIHKIWKISKYALLSALSHLIIMYRYLLFIDLCIRLLICCAIPLYCSGGSRRNLRGWEEDETPGTCEEEEGAGVPEGLEAGVGEDASAGNESPSTSREISARTALLPSASSHMYSASIRRMLVEDEGVSSISLTVTGNGREVCFYLAIIAISCEISSPRSMRLLDMIELRQASFRWRKMDSFWDRIFVLLIKPNQNLAVMLRSLFSIGAPASIHLRVVSKIRGTNQPFNSSRD